MSKNTLFDLFQIPNFKTIEDFEELIEMTGDVLAQISLYSDNYYTIAFIPKRDGDFRELFIPSEPLCYAQRWILDNILNKLSPSDYAMAFRKGDDYGQKQNALCHLEESGDVPFYGLSLDLKDFFPSIKANKVYTIFASIGYNNFAATILTHLCTLNGELPQGSPCSPALSNLVCMKMDKRLSGLCESHISEVYNTGAKYSRYADDMYFSCNDKALLLRLYPTICKIVEDEGFVINEKKTKFQTPSNKKQITGITISTSNPREAYELKAPRKLKQTIRAEIYTCMITGNYDLREHIVGEIAYVQYVESENETAYLVRIKTYIDKIGEKIRIFPELVEAYNSHKFFKDSSDVIKQEVQTNTKEERNEYKKHVAERKRFLEKRHLKDICEYRY